MPASARKRDNGRPPLPHRQPARPLSLSTHTPLTLAPPPLQMNLERLQKLAGSVRTGGKGTMRR